MFGVPSRNVQYCRVLKSAMDERGHPVKLIFATYNATVLALSKIIVDEVNCRCKGEGLVYFTSIKRQSFFLKWHAKNEGYLQAQMGLGDSNSFLTGILFSMNASLTTVPHLQTLSKRMHVTCISASTPCSLPMEAPRTDL